MTELKAKKIKELEQLWMEGGDLFWIADQLSGILGRAVSVGEIDGAIIKNFDAFIKQTDLEQYP